MHVHRPALRSAFTRRNFAAAGLLMAGIMLSCKNEPTSGTEPQLAPTASASASASASKGAKTDSAPSKTDTAPSIAESAPSKAITSESGAEISGSDSETKESQPVAPKPESAKSEPPKDKQESGVMTKTDKGCPSTMARAGNFCIDRFEIALIRKDKSFYPFSDVPPYNMAGIIAISKPGIFPQGFMSQVQAKTACEAAGKRLCTSDEWETACVGAKKQAFPYGNEHAEGKCNVNKREPHILDKLFPDIQHLKRTGTQFNDPMLALEPGYLSQTGEYPQCVTESGVFDMDGNLSEWVSDTRTRDGQSITFGVFRGAPFSGYTKEGCARKTDAHDQKYHDYSTGARCCADAK